MPCKRRWIMGTLNEFCKQFKSYVILKVLSDRLPNESLKYFQSSHVTNDLRERMWMRLSENISLQTFYILIVIYPNKYQRQLITKN